MKKSNFASIEYSKELADLFPESEWWADMLEDEHNYEEEFWIVVDSSRKQAIRLWYETSTESPPLYPALTTDMLLERVTDRTTIYRDVFKNRTIYTVFINWTDGEEFKDKSSPTH